MSKNENLIGWSDLCNTSLEAYLAFLDVNFYNGAGTCKSGCGHGSSGYQGCNGSCDHNGGSVDCTMLVDDGDGCSSRCGDGVGVSGAVGHESAVCGCVKRSSVCSGDAVKRLSGFYSVSSERGIRGSVGDVVGRNWKEESDSKVDGRSMGSTSGVSHEVSCVEVPVGSCPVGSSGGSVNVVAKGKHWKKNLAKRLSRKRSKVVSSQVCVESSVEKKKSELASSFDDRRIAENKLATQKAEYQLKKNEYMTRSRVAEQQWETERLTCDQKLQKISEARFGSKPGFAETLVSANISSSSLPSLSQGTLSPDSSISVAEVNRMFKLIADLTAQVAQLTVESKAMKETAVLSAYEQRKLEMENMTFEQIAALRGTEKDIRPDGSPVKYDAIGQEIYSECGRPDFMNQYDYRSSITVSEDGQ